MGRYRRYYSDDWDDDDGPRYWRRSRYYDDDGWDDDEYHYSNKRYYKQSDDDDDWDDDWDDWDGWDDDGYVDWRGCDYYPQFDPEFLGEYGEQLTEEELATLNEMKNSGKILRNLYIPKVNGKTTEIDLVYITKKGIFVIESKNYSGWIFGNEKDNKWTATFPNGERRRFYNPVKQNENHIKWLKQYIRVKVPCYSLIVFSERCELKKITVTTPGVGVVKRDKMVPLLLLCWDKFRDYLNESSIETLYALLSKCANADFEIKKKHVDDMERG